MSICVLSLLGIMMGNYNRHIDWHIIICTIAIVVGIMSKKGIMMGIL